MAHSGTSQFGGVLRIARESDGSVAVSTPVALRVVVVAVPRRVQLISRGVTQPPYSMSLVTRRRVCAFGRRCPNPVVAEVPITAGCPAPGASSRDGSARLSPVSVSTSTVNRSVAASPASTLRPSLLPSIASRLRCASVNLIRFRPKLFPEHLVLLPEIFNCVLLLAVQPARRSQDEELESLGHPASLPDLQRPEKAASQGGFEASAD